MQAEDEDCWSHCDDDEECEKFCDAVDECITGFLDSGVEDEDDYEYSDDCNDLFEDFDEMTGDDELFLLKDDEDFILEITAEVVEEEDDCMSHCGVGDE